MGFAGILDGLMGPKQKELEDRMIASISASRELTVELRKKHIQDEKLIQSLDRMTNALCAWTQKAEEIKHLVLSNRKG